MIATTVATPFVVSRARASMAAPATVFVFHARTSCQVLVFAEHLLDLSLDKSFREESGSAWALADVPTQALKDHLGNFLRVASGCPRQSAPHDTVHELLDVGSLEWYAETAELIKDTAQRPHVGRVPIGLLLTHLRAEVVWGADHRPGKTVIC